MSLALSPAATANTAPLPLPNAAAAAATPASAPAPVKSGAKAGAKPEAAPAGDSATAEFQRALQRLVQGAAMPAEDADAAALLARAAMAPVATGDSARDDTAPDDTNTAQDAPALPMADLLLSGMLLVPAAMPTTPLASLAPATPISTATSDAAATPIAMPDAATLASATLAASPAAAMAAPLPALPNAMAASPEAAAALASMPAGNRFMPAQAATADDASALPDTATTPSAPAASSTRQGVNLAALASMVVPPHQPGSAREQRNANTPTSIDLQNPDVASGMTGATHDIATRETGLQTAPGSGSTRGTHSLIEALGERIAQQLQRGGDRAVIRLDPPMQGQLEITIHRDATGATQVHLAATNGDVARQLQTISDSLRQELVNRQNGEVTVLVSQGGREHNGRQGQQQQAPQDGPGRALADAGTDSAQGAARFALSSIED